MSLPTCLTSFSVISANASAALLWRSMLSENDNVVSAESGEPVKKLVVVRSTDTSLSKCILAIVSNETYFRGTVAGRRLPLARSRAGVAHKLVISAILLFIVIVRNIQHNFGDPQVTYSKMSTLP